MLHAMTVHTYLWDAQYGVRSRQETTCSCGFKAHGDATKEHEHQVILDTLGLKFTVEHPKGTYS